MSVVTVFSGSRCSGEEVAAGVARELGYPLIDAQLIDQAAERFGAAPESLRRAMHGAPSLLNTFTHERERCIAYLTLALAELLKGDNAVYHGFAGHLVPRTISHVLRVCVIANRDWRVRRAVQELGVSEGKAAKAVEREDKERYQWVYSLTKKKPWEAGLYDIVVPMHDRSVDEAVALICKNARGATVQATDASRRVIEDFARAAAVNKELVEKGYRYDVTCEAGHVVITLDKEVLMMSRLEDKLDPIARAVEGVKDVTVRAGAPSAMETPFGRIEAEPPIKVLLVDDEREFVETLSERLRVRELRPTVAYDGEQALAAVEKDEPEVMILDLKMPGIDGMEVLRRIKKERPRVEVIILTGHGSQEDERRAKELGAFAYLEKPVDISILTDVMKEAYRKVHESKDGQ